MTAAVRTLSLALCILVPALGYSAPLSYTAQLDGATENPSNASTGTGTAFVVYDPTVHLLGVSVSFQDLLWPVTAAHIHCCVDAPGNTGVATTTPSFPGFPSGVTSGSYNQTFDLTQASSFGPGFLTAWGDVAGAEDELARGLAAGQAYFNIHSEQLPSGEIRGFLQQVPEPATLLLLGGGLLGLALRRR